MIVTAVHRRQFDPIRSQNHTQNPPDSPVWGSPSVCFQLSCWINQDVHYRFVCQFRAIWKSLAERQLDLSDELKCTCCKGRSKNSKRGESMSGGTEMCEGMKFIIFFLWCQHYFYRYERGGLDRPGSTLISHMFLKTFAIPGLGSNPSPKGGSLIFVDRT